MYMYTTQKIVVVNQNIVTATAKHAIRKMEKKAKCWILSFSLENNIIIAELLNIKSTRSTNP